jgi:hypothetical protein
MHEVRCAFAVCIPRTVRVAGLRLWLHLYFASRSTKESITAAAAVSALRRYKKCLQTFLSAFYHNNAASVSRSDYHVYMVLAYVMLFRLSELGMPRLSFLMAAQDSEKMYTLMSFMFNLEAMETWCKEEWCRSLDRKFVEVRRRRA